MNQDHLAQLKMSNSKLKIAVLGPIPKDHITTHTGEVIEKYGCVSHTTIALSQLLGDQGTVIPVTHVCKADEGPVKDIFKSYDNIQIDHITSDMDQGDVVSLKFLDENNRLEKQTGFMNPIVPADIADILNCDAYICVPITDYEVPILTLQYIKQNSDGIIVFDAHGPTTALTTKGDRCLKYWAGRDMWLPYIDVLKMNIEESRCGWFGVDVPPNDPKSGEHLFDFADHCLSHGVSAVVVTLDSDGAMAYTKSNGITYGRKVDSIKVDNVVDTTGCGDSFAAGLGFGLTIGERNIETALKYANAMGSQRTQGRTFEVFKSREETEKMIVDYYGNL